MRVLVIIPAYNEQHSIARVVDQLAARHPQYDYVVVNDGSRDATEGILAAKGFSYISQPINLGIGGAVQCGYKYAQERGYDIAVQLDGDGQHDPAFIPALIDPILSGQCSMVIGSRFIHGEGFQTTTMRRLGIRLFQFIIRLCCGQVIHDATSGFRAINKGLISLFAGSYAQDYPEPESILLAIRHGHGVREMPVRMHARDGGISSINPIKAAYYMIKVSLSLLLYGTGRPRRRGARHGA